MEALFSAVLLFAVVLYISRPFWATASAALPQSPSDGRFCTDCGGKNPKDSRFCGKCGKALLVALILFLASAAQATPGMGDPATQPPHSDMQVGQLEGTLVKNGKPLAGREVVIQVIQGGQTLLTLPKKTDEKGLFVFKNIFKDPQYSYVLLAEDDGKIYRHGPVQLTGKQDALKVVFAIRPEAVADATAAPMPTEESHSKHHAKAPKQWEQQKTIAVILSAFVLAIVAYALGRYQRKK